MADINPEWHEYGYVFVPINRVTAIFSSPDDVRSVVRELNSMGFEPGAVDIFVGEEGARMLDLSGEGHGAATRRLRNFEALMVLDAGQAHRQAETTLKAGGVALAVLMDGREKMKEAVAAMLKRHQATMIRFWGRWTTEAFD